MKPHDLLKIDWRPYRREISNSSDWVLPSLKANPWVVVRRARSSESSKIAVGIRGKKKQERMGIEIVPSDILKVVCPYELYAKACWDTLPEERRQLPIVRKVDWIRSSFPEYHFGLAGSVGFECCTQSPVVTDNSDLDLIFEMEQPNSKLLAEMAVNFIEKNQWLDIQVSTTAGSFALREWWQRRRPEILLKTVDGPRLTLDPWEKQAELNYE